MCSEVQVSDVVLVWLALSGAQQLANTCSSGLQNIMSFNQEMLHQSHVQTAGGH